MSRPIWVRWLAVLAVTAICWMGKAEAGVLGKKAPAYVPSGEWEAFFSSKKGGASPILQPIEQNRDQDWMFLRFTDYSGPKIRVAVMRVENRTASTQAADRTETVVVADPNAEVPVAALDEMLTTALLGTNRFEIVERKEIESILSEQDLGASGRTKKATAPKTGNLIGAEYMVFASVNEWTPVKSKTGGAGGKAAGPLGLLGVEKSTAEVAMSFRIVDTATSQTLHSIIERSTAGNWAFGLAGMGGDGSGAFSAQKASPINYAVQACINKGIYKLAMWLKDRPWSGAVASVDGAEIYLNAGSNSGLKTGMELTALARGKELFDPITKESLGEKTTEIGVLRIMNVQEKYSVAEIVEGCKGLKQGDRVRLRSVPSATVATTP